MYVVSEIISTLSPMGTRMVASGSTLRPHLERVIRGLFCLLHAKWHGTEALLCTKPH